MNRTAIFAAVALLTGAVVSHGNASAQVVADSACPKHAVDIASFATCDGERVAGRDVRLISARAAFDLKQTHGTDVLLVDVRSAAQVEADGTAADVSAVLPYPPQGGAAADLQFVALVDVLVAMHGGNEHTTLVMLCADGSLAMRAAASLAEAGYRQLAVVEGGVDGVATASTKAGWKAAQLPWTRHIDARRLYPYAG